jgi:hypothetical protein
MILQADWYICKKQLSNIKNKAEDLTHQAESAMVSFYNAISEIKGPELLAKTIAEACSSEIENLKNRLKTSELFSELRHNIFS